MARRAWSSGDPGQQAVMDAGLLLALCLATAEDCDGSQARALLRASSGLGSVRALQRPAGAPGGGGIRAAGPGRHLGLRPGRGPRPGLIPGDPPAPMGDEGGAVRAGGGAGPSRPISMCSRSIRRGPG